MHRVLFNPVDPQGAALAPSCGNVGVTKMIVGMMAATLLAACQQSSPAPSAPKTGFAGMDTNGDGAITRFEHAAGASAMFQVMDADHNGRVTVAEMDATAPKSGASTGLTSTQKIEALDSDVDGNLSAEEQADGAKAMFARLDTNRDGSLSQAEYDAGPK